jgi:protein-disulfide isomerase
VTRLTVRFAGALAVGVLAMSSFQILAQEPAAPAAPAAAPVFPKPDPGNFTAAYPTKEAVASFLQASWGWDENRIWQVQAIQKTKVDSMSRVVVFWGDKQGKQRPAALQFYVLSDGKHAIASDEIITFGDHPYAEARAELQKRADGPYRNSPVKDLEIVEFADFTAQHGKDAQANFEKLAADFPKARIVFQNYPATARPQSVRAAEYGVCVAKLAGNDAFFTFANAVFEAQEGLANADGATLTLNSAATKAGVDTAKLTACVDTPETKAAVESSIKLGKDVGVGPAPVVLVNGRPIQIGGAAYDILKKIVTFQAQLDGAAQ